MIIPLVQPGRITNSKDQAIKQGGAKGAMAEAETKFVEVGQDCKLFFGRP